MAHLTYSDISDYLDAGKSEAEIVAILEPLGVTVSRIKLADLRWYLRDQGLIYKGVDVPYVGPFTELVRSEQTPSELRLGLTDFITHVFGTDEYLDTTDYVIAARGVAILAGLIQAGVMTPEQRDGFYTLGGGRRFEGVTELDVSECRRMHEITTRLQAAYEAGIVERDNGGDVVSVKAALDAAWGA